MTATPSIDDFARARLAVLDDQNRRRAPVSTRRLPRGRVERVVDGVTRVLVDFSSNDSLGLSHHHDVTAAARAAIDDGAGAGGSRLVSGSHPDLVALERKIALLKQKEAALVCGSGWLANVGVIPALVGKRDVVVIDEFAHASLMAGARLSQARVVVVAHNDVDGFGAAVDGAADGANVVVVTESVFSMDGDRAPLTAIAARVRPRAWLIVDDAHGFLVDTAAECAAVAEASDVVTGTLSKAVGGYGGVIAGSQVLIDLLFTRARPVLFGTALPPSSIAGALAAVSAAADDVRLRQAPRAWAQRFCRKVGLAEPASHIVPLIVGDEGAALALAAGLQDDGYLVVAIRPPTVPAGTSRLRVGFSAAHSEADVDGLATAVLRRFKAHKP